MLKSICKTLFVPIHPEGWRFIILFLVITFGLSFLSEYLFIIGCILTIWCVYFYRDPIRQINQSDTILSSPADGVICCIDNATPPKELGLGDVTMKRIGIFMNVFDCHVNRTVTEGTIKKIAYHKGQFLNASLDKASEKNERNSVLIEDSQNDTYIMTQIAGLVARRIVCASKEGDHLQKGQRFGIIRFGSRVDVYMPEHVTPNVTIGQKSISGETILGYKNGTENHDFKAI